jgi:hypothetical protein
MLALEAWRSRFSYAFLERSSGRPFGAHLNASSGFELEAIVAVALEETSLYDCAIFRG